MTAFMHFLSKEITEIRRTWRGPTTLGVLLFFAVMSPLAALATPALMESVTASQPGLVIEVPDPTYVDSYAQWIKNLAQMGLLLVVFASGGLIANERSSGTAVLVVTKPVSRHAFALAKYVAQALLVTVATVVGTLITYAGTVLAFGSDAPLGDLVTATAAWLGGALLAIAFVEVLSASFPTLAAGIGGLVAWGMIGLLAAWGPAARYSPAGLLGAPGEILAGKDVALMWPILTAIPLTVALIWLAGALFSRKEL